jgi:pimeloyl-ACP methyl ester carboxylesterase
MAHGFAAECGFGLPAFAEQFVARKLAVYMFDYSHFGASEGEPRHLLNPALQIRNWRAAVEHLRRLPDIQSDRIALWGTSFSGGHVLAVAAKTPGLAAVVAQVPFVDGLAVTMNSGLGFALEGTLHGLRDILRAVTFRQPYYVPVVADPDTFAVMNTPESKPGYLALIPEGSTWVNRCPARIFWRIPFYRPGNLASKIRCPVMIIAAEKDSLIPLKAVEKTARKIKEVEYIALPVGHFALYAGDTFDHVSALQANFLQQHLV